MPRIRKQPVTAWFNARHAAIGILAARFERRFSLQTQFQNPAFLQLKPADQLLAREIVDVVLRNLSLLDFWLESVSSRPPAQVDATVLWVLRTAAAQIRLMRVPEWAAVDEAVELCVRLGEGRLKGFVNGVLRALIRNAPEPPAGRTPEALAIRHSHPLWLTRRLMDRWGSEPAAQVMAAHNLHPPPVVWVNPFRASLEQFCRRLDEREMPYSLVPGLSRGVRIDYRGLVRDPLYTGGFCFFMDAASQRVAELGDLDSARQVADLCAGSGGKSFVLVSRLRAGAGLVSCDRHPGRLVALRHRARQLDIPIDRLVRLDAARHPPFAPRFDFILLDVPCSGLGTLRANPDLRWFIREADLERHRVRQSAMLESAFAVLAPGGQLVYSTCSSEPEENELVVEPVLSRHRISERQDDPYRPALDDPGSGGFFTVLIRRP